MSFLTSIFNPVKFQLTKVADEIEDQTGLTVDSFQLRYDEANKKVSFHIPQEKEPDIKEPIKIPLSESTKTTFLINAISAMAKAKLSKNETLKYVVINYNRNSETDNYSLLFYVDETGQTKDARFEH